MSQALYRKYRPTTFAEVIGQNHIKLTLQNEVELGNISHAYLFSGPRGIGKTTLARLFAKVANCQERDPKNIEPCGKCQSCLNIQDNRSLDVIEIDAASQTGVDNVRENIIENVRFTPHSSKYKVFIIDEVHMLSLSAFNALLKTLEEPPEHAIFILCTTELYKLPETIISRCQRFDFKKISPKDMIAKLSWMTQQEGVDVEDQVIQAVARKADGFMRDAESLLGQVLALGKKNIHMDDVSFILPRSDYKQAADLIGFIIDKNADLALDVVNHLTEEGIDLERFNQDIIEYLRKIILAKVSTQDEVDFSQDMGHEIEEMIFKQVSRVSLEQLINMANIFVAKQTSLKNTHIAQFPLELAVVEIIGETDSLSVSPGPQTHIPQEEPATNPPTKTAKTLQTEPTQNTQHTDKKTNPQVNIDQIKKNWDNVVEASKKYNHALQFILKISYPIKLDGQFLNLGFEYAFHKERLNDRKNKTLVEKVLTETFDSQIIIRPCLLNAQELAKFKTEKEKNTIDDEKVLNDVLQVFDGKLIDEENKQSVA